MKRAVAVWCWVFLLCCAAGNLVFVSAGKQQTLSNKPESRISYTLKHPLHTVNGESAQISSQLTVAEGKRLQQVKVSVPVRSFDSGNRARDRDMLEVTEADRFPTVSFISSSITELNGALTLTGGLTFHGVTREIQFAARQER